MTEVDPFETQRGVPSFVTSKLSSEDFDDVREIGRGGFGVVYRCTQLPLDRTVAVKVLVGSLDEDEQKRFHREQRAMGRLTAHPNIVTVLQVGVADNGAPLIVMPYYSRGSLDSHIRRDGPLSADEVIHLGVRLSSALDAAHRQGVIHCDVKPANVLLSEYGEPALADFGIARTVGAFETAQEIVAGTPAFIAPEVLDGGCVSPASDIYGLGATLFCALTGRAPFERRSGEQVAAQFIRITAGALPDLRGWGFADDLAVVVEKAMSAEPEARHPSALALGQSLSEVGRHSGTLGDGEMANTPRRRSNTILPANSRSSPTHRANGNLPAELSSFVGRRQELTEAKRLLAASRLLTLVGIGGVGKTRLALRLATGIQSEFTDGAWLVELDEVRTASRLYEVVATVFGLRDQTDRPLSEILSDYLSSRELLLILDNCEQVVDAVAEFATAILQHTHNTRIVVTSREILTVAGEHSLRVPPLTVPQTDRDPTLEGLPKYDAVSLFAQRAKAAVPTFSLTNANKLIVTRICQRLDGLPLPLELAAARLTSMSPQQVLQRLSDRYALLTRGSRGAPSRQQTLRLCIDWSYDLCSPDEQKTWERLSVFSGSFELDAAEYVCADCFETGNLLNLVASLVDKSILIRDEHRTEVRFRMLETLRAYGREKVSQNGGFDEAHRRHRWWYCELARTAEAEFIGPRQIEWLTRFDSERPNLREAMEFCLSDSATGADPDDGLLIATSLCHLWGSRGLFGEARGWLDRFLSRSTERNTIATVRALYANCLMAEQQGDHEQGAALADQARRAAHILDNPVAEAIVDHADGIVGLFSGDLPRAVSGLGQAATEFRKFENELALRVESLNLLGLAYHVIDDEPTREIACYDEVLSITEPRGESVYRSYALWSMAVAQWRLGEHERATELLQQGLRLTRLVNDPVGCANFLEVFAWMAASRKPQRAGVLLEAAKRLGRTAGSPVVFVPHLLVYHEACEREVRHALKSADFEASCHKGESMDIDSAVAYALNERPPIPKRQTTSSITLTKRERQVAELIVEGLTNKAIADSLIISPRTVHGHVEHILTKLGFSSRTQIAAWVVEERRYRQGSGD